MFSILGFAKTFAAGTTLSPGDLVIVTANATDPDLFEFVSRIDLSTGTVIYFADNAWKEDNTRRA